MHRCTAKHDDGDDEPMIYIEFKQFIVRVVVVHRVCLSLLRKQHLEQLVDNRAKCEREEEQSQRIALLDITHTLKSERCCPQHGR